MILDKNRLVPTDFISLPPSLIISTDFTFYDQLPLISVSSLLPDLHSSGFVGVQRIKGILIPFKKIN